MQVGAIIIGDELLSGKRSDKHLAALIGILSARGMKLSWADYLGDEPARISATLERAFASGELAFSFGGIGATPDDYTRACAASALGVPLVLHPEAQILIEQRFGSEAYPHRINMGVFPQGARIIPNPVNQIPGFSLGDVHFVPGFPAMAWPMIEWVLDQHYSHLHCQEPEIERTVIAVDAREGDLIDLMQQFVLRFPSLKFSSLPSFGTKAIQFNHIEFGFTGPKLLVEQAMAAFRSELQQRGLTLLETKLARASSD